MATSPKTSKTQRSTPKAGSTAKKKPAAKASNTGATGRGGKAAPSRARR